MKFSKIFLIGISILIVLLCIFLGINNKSEIKVTEIKGDRSALGNATIISETIENIYQVKEVSISKSGINKNNFAFSKPVRFSEEGDIVKNPAIINSYNTNEIYKTKTSIGSLTTSLYYNDSSNDESELVVNINEENIESKKVKSYMINLGVFFDDSLSNASITSVPIVYEDDLYAVVRIDIDDLSKNNQFDGSADISRIYVCKLDLKNESGEIILVKDINDDSYYSLVHHVAFSKDYTAYFVNEKYDRDKNNNNIIVFELLSFNLKNKTFNTIEIGKNINDTKLLYINKAYLIGNKAYLINEYTYDNKFKINEIEVDLEENKVTNKENTYLLDIGKISNNTSYSLQNIRCIANKLFISVELQESEYSSAKGSYIPSNYVFVVDRQSKETLYAVRIEAGIDKNSTISVINN